MFICNSSWSFHRMIPQRMKLLEFPAKCASLGIEAVELLEYHFESKEEKYLDSLKSACQKAGVKIACLAIGNDFTIVDDKERAKEIKNVIESLNIANYLGAPVMRVFCGTRSVTDAAVHRVIESYKEVVPIAKKLNIKLGMENHWGASVNPDNVVRIIEGVDSPYFGSCPDFGNWQPDDRYTAMAAVAPYAVHVHAKSHAFLPNGEEKDLDYRRLLDILRDAGYDGALSIEFEGKGNEITGVKKTVALLKKYL
ncbi:MAG: sugar phosphate isomerase/epimerase [bacterium]|nr:sugar phosphate isomerase/epimerase [bacterium]